MKLSNFFNFTLGFTRLKIRSVRQKFTEIRCEGSVVSCNYYYCVFDEVRWKCCRKSVTINRTPAQNRISLTVIYRCAREISIKSCILSLNDLLTLTLHHTSSESTIHKTLAMESLVVFLLLLLYSIETKLVFRH